MSLELGEPGIGIQPVSPQGEKATEQAPKGSTPTHDPKSRWSQIPLLLF